METATTSTTTVATTVMLTSGASGRVAALLSIRALKSLVLLIKAFLLFVFLLPIHLGLFGLGWRTTATIKQSSSSSSTSSSSDDKKQPPQQEKDKDRITCATRNPFFFFLLGGGGRKMMTPEPPAVGAALVMVPHKKSSMSVVVGPGNSEELDAATRRELAITRALDDEDNDDYDVTTRMRSSRRQVSLFQTSRGDTLFTQSWSPTTTNIRGLVVLMHGLNEHSGRYNDFAKKLNANGFKVYGMDWIGHGGSDGLHAYVHSLDYAVSDLKAFLEQIVAENSELPCFCFGHSTGGAIVLKSILDSSIKALVKGVVLTSPAVRVQPSHPIVGVLAPIFSYLLPRYQFRAANKNGTVVSRDPEALIAKYSDPLVYTGSIRVRTGYEILRISSYLQENLERLTIPFLVLHGTSDAVTDPEASVELYEKAPAADKSVKLYKGLLHDLLFEPEREVVAKDIIEWLNSRM